MGVLNVTPDSFSDGGRWASTEAAVRHALDLQSEGADLIVDGTDGGRHLTQAGVWQDDEGADGHGAAGSVDEKGPAPCLPGPPCRTRR